MKTRSFRSTVMVVMGLSFAATACGEMSSSNSTEVPQGFSYAPFDRDEVMTDAMLSDGAASDTNGIQALLEQHQSVLARYGERGQTAAAVITQAAAKHRINPIALLVRAELEQHLLSREHIDEDTLALAFGCACRELAVCDESVEGLSRQADCAAKALRDGMNAAISGGGTTSGWRVGVTKATKDGFLVTPKNAATAALYSYLPWVGELGGGQARVAGVVSFMKLWKGFASDLGALGPSK